MRLGIIGFPQSGKTTIFNALTRGDQPVTMSGGRVEIHTAVVDVPDSRVDRLASLFNPQKTTYAKVTYADIAGLEGANGKKGMAGPLLNQLNQVDGLLHVVRCFENTSVPHSLGSVDPMRDIASMDADLLLNDLIAVERKLERLTEEIRRNVKGDKAQMEREAALFARFNDALQQEIPLRDMDFTEEALKEVSGFGFLTLKPMLILLNLSEGQAAPVIDYPHKNSLVVSLQGKLEMDLAQLPSDEAELFKSAYGLEELGLAKVINLSYDLLGYQSFFTVGEDEVRAWRARRGASAYDAAGVIHSDLQKGFIRAEVISQEDLLALGGLNQARSNGKLRLEGKDYFLHDGDIMHVRFSL
ncbi:MAG: redox-regulated ATPase YchF [Anaerolineales bacterium]|nr:redox-regulated ATPase YchF [Anaerolineales bacterium]